MRKNATLSVLRRLWGDTRGAMAPADLILMTTITAIGVMVGLVIVRDSVVQEMGDVAVALDNVDQSFGVEVVMSGVGTVYTALYVDDAATLTDPVGSEPACLDVGGTQYDEGEALATVGTPFP
ncbi:MAG: hypothetical protein U1A77_18040 [Pirellulales bacterium]